MCVDDERVPLTEYFVHGRKIAVDGQKESFDRHAEFDQLGVHGFYPTVFLGRVVDELLQMRPQSVHVLLLFRRSRLVDRPLFVHTFLQHRHIFPQVVHLKNNGPYRYQQKSVRPGAADWTVRKHESPSFTDPVRSGSERAKKHTHVLRCLAR